MNQEIKEVIANLKIQCVYFFWSGQSFDEESLEVEG